MGFLKRLLCRKHIEWESLHDSTLHRCLTTKNLITLGVGCTLGAGVYVLTGQVAADKAGPAVILSFFFAAVASLLSGICYAELGSRVPKAGSAYVYSYVCVGEILAFFIGWNLLLEYVIGTASVARAWSGNLDALFDGKVAHFFNDTIVRQWQWHMPVIFSPYPDVLAFVVVMSLTFVLSIGVKESAKLNDVFTIVNVLVIIYVIICGLFRADLKNWNIKPEDIPVSAKVGGSGGFFPYGLSGALAGASSCFYAFVGFDVIATTGEEAINPSRAIPLGITGSLLIVFVAYVSSAAVLTLMVPYYKFHGQAAPLPFAFAEVGFPATKYLISIGALCGLTSSLLVGMFPMSRIVYAMANDGLLYKWTGRVSTRYQTPLIATVLTGSLAAVFAMLFSLEQLVEMMSIGTLLAYMLVAICVLILRYSSESFPKRASTPDSDTMHHSDYAGNHRPHLVAESGPERMLPAAGSVAEVERRQPTCRSSIIANIAVVSYVTSVFALCAMLIFKSHAPTEWWSILLTAAFGLSSLSSVAILAMQPQNSQPLAFKVPLVPFLPLISIFFNTYLMLMLSSATWIRFLVWLVLGSWIYFSYGIWNSHAGHSVSHTNVVNSASPTLEESANVTDRDFLAAQPMNNAAIGYDDNSSTHSDVHNDNEQTRLLVSQVARSRGHKSR